jgi:hypothetical protein
MKSWLTRTFRGRQLDHNQLRRRSDRAETVAIILLVAAFAFAAPLVVWATAAGAYSLAQQARATALATQHEVTAVTLQVAPSDGYAQPYVSASWTAPDERRRTGQIQVDAGTTKGTARRIWVTGPGDVVPPPLPASESSQLADLAAVGAGLGLVVFFLLAGTTTRHILNRKRMATWDAEWAAVEPRWNRQRW